MCCSGLGSKETPLLEESFPSQKLNKNKRSGSPSPMSANKAIMKCGVSGNMLIEISMECPKISQKGSEDMSFTGLSYQKCNKGEIALLMRFPTQKINELSAPILKKIYK